MMIHRQFAVILDSEIRAESWLRSADDCIKNGLQFLRWQTSLTTSQINFKIIHVRQP